MTSRPPPERSSSIVEKMKFRRRSDSQTVKAKQDQQPQANMAANMDSANIDSPTYTSGEWSDVTVTCKNYVWRLHKDILMTKCDYFRDRCMAEQESSQAEVGLRSS